MANTIRFSNFKFPRILLARIDYSLIDYSQIDFSLIKAMYSENMTGATGCHWMPGDMSEHRDFSEQIKRAIVI